MTSRIGIQYDILSDSSFKCIESLSLPTFKVADRTFIKRSTIIVEKNIVKKVFFPIYSVNKHVDKVLEWLKEN